MRFISARTVKLLRHTIVVVLALTALVLPGKGIAAPPSNDNFADATSITSLPLSETVGVTEATTETGEPVTWYGQSRTVWWSLTPAKNTIIRIARASCCQFISVYQANSPGFDGLARISGAGDPWVVFSLNGGTTYYVQSGDDYPYGWTTAVTLSIDEVLPPVNDDFADAKSFSDVPFSDAPDMTAATVKWVSQQRVAQTFNDRPGTRSRPRRAARTAASPSIMSTSIPARRFSI